MHESVIGMYLIDKLLTLLMPTAVTGQVVSNKEDEIDDGRWQETS